MATERKHTIFQICDRHAAWFAGTTRERKAETFVEGGPGGMRGCSGGRCRLWPGRDFFVAEICREELPLDWTTGYYEPPEDRAGTVFDPTDETFGPIMAAIQAGDFEGAVDLLADLTPPPGLAATA